MRSILLIASILFMATAATATGSALSIQRSVFVETTQADGIALEPANTLSRGDRVVLVMQWDGGKPARPFTLASRVPETLSYQRSGDDRVEVSVDGGRRWGQLGELRQGQRAAQPDEVTNLRWRIGTNDSSGMRSFSAIVR
ncbi:hypothetical protein A9995_12390 [Erythrobacter sp. QSSC1-22B]|nr:hypothetical protein A9995_12390 [Erythrobacter sp. QSSC1-22B]